jgi:hypothetical protein
LNRILLVQLFIYFFFFVVSWVSSFFTSKIPVCCDSILSKKNPFLYQFEDSVMLSRTYLILDVIFIIYLFLSFCLSLIIYLFIYLLFVSLALFILLAEKHFFFSHRFVKFLLFLFLFLFNVCVFYSFSLFIYLFVSLDNLLYYIVLYNFLSTLL